jgi:hypothetical protein
MVASSIATVGVVYFTGERVDYRKSRQRNLTLDSLGFETERDRHINKVRTKHADPNVQAQLQVTKKLLLEAQALEGCREYELKPVPKTNEYFN